MGGGNLLRGPIWARCITPLRGAGTSNVPPWRRCATLYAGYTILKAPETVYPDLGANCFDERDKPRSWAVNPLVRSLGLWGIRGTG